MYNFINALSGGGSIQRLTSQRDSKCSITKLAIHQNCFFSSFFFLLPNNFEVRERSNCRKLQVPLPTVPPLKEYERERPPVVREGVRPRSRILALGADKSGGRETKANAARSTVCCRDNRRLRGCGRRTNPRSPASPAGVGGDAGVAVAADARRLR